MTARAEFNCRSAIRQINPNSSSGPHFTSSLSAPAAAWLYSSSSSFSTCGTAVRRCHVSPRRLGWTRAQSGGALLLQTSKPVHVASAAVAESKALDASSSSSSSFSSALHVRKLRLFQFFFLKDSLAFFFCCFGVFFFQRRCFLAPASSTPPPPESGGTLSVAQRDSAVSDYRPCAEEPPAQSASLWGRNSTQDSGGTRAKEESVLREEFFPFLFFSFSSPSSAF